jgi:hypothetical protein
MLANGGKAATNTVRAWLSILKLSAKHRPTTQNYRRAKDSIFNKIKQSILNNLILGITWNAVNAPCRHFDMRCAKRSLIHYSLDAYSLVC